MRRTNAVESVSSTPMPGLYSSWTSVRRMGLKADRLGLRGLRVDPAQRDHEAEPVTNLAGVDIRLLPTILLTSEE